MLTHKNIIMGSGMPYKPRKASPETNTHVDMGMQGNWGRRWSFPGRGESKCKCPQMGVLRNSQKASVTGVEHKRRNVTPNETREEADVKSYIAL